MAQKPWEKDPEKWRQESERLEKEAWEAAGCRNNEEYHRYLKASFEQGEGLVPDMVEGCYIGTIRD